MAACKTRDARFRSSRIKKVLLARMCVHESVHSSCRSVLGNLYRVPKIRTRPGKVATTPSICLSMGEE